MITINNLNRKKLISNVKSMKYLDDIRYAYESKINTSKKNYIEELDLITIDREIEILRSDLVWLRVKKESRQDWKPSEFKALKRKIAQLQCIHRKKHLSHQSMSDNNSFSNSKSRRKPKQETTSSLLKIYQIKRTSA